MNAAESRSHNTSIDLADLSRIITGNSPLPMLAVSGMNHSVTHANDAFCRLIGKKDTELIGRPIAEAVPEEMAQGCVEMLARLATTGQSQVLADQKIQHHKPHPLYWSYVLWPVHNEGQMPTGVIVQITDTTAATLEHLAYIKIADDVREANQQLLISAIREKELAEAARIAKEELHQAQKMESLGRLAGGIAHDFNNLLTIILGFGELAELSLPSDSPAQRHLEKIRNAGLRAAELTAQLLAFARKQMIAPQIVDVNSHIHSVNILLSRLIGANIELIFTPSADIEKVRIDPGQFGQILINLVTNARDAMPNGGRITLSTAKGTQERVDNQTQTSTVENTVILSVTDTGCGISEENMSHLFEPFYTTKEVGKGTGLGLATCEGIIRQNGGQINVESTPGKGTTFSIVLPCADEAVTLTQPEQELSLPGGIECILIVEDEQNVREMTAQALREQGYTVIEAENGVKALQVLHDYEGEIDLLLTDVLMPHMGGSELAEQFHLLRPDVPVLFTSGYTEDVFLRQGVQNMEQPFLQKPFTLLALGRKVREVLDNLPKAVS